VPEGSQTPSLKQVAKEVRFGLRRLCRPHCLVHLSGRRCDQPATSPPPLILCVSQLHDSVREVVVRDGLIPEAGAARREHCGHMRPPSICRWSHTIGCAAEWEKVPLKVGREQTSEAEPIVDESSDERFLRVEDLKTQVKRV